MTALPSITTRARHWFLHSGIQEPSGGVARFYRYDLGRNAALSTEITGYTISALLDLACRLEDEACASAARKAGLFLTRRAWDSGTSIFPFECGPNGEPAPQPRAYFFDSGIIVRGLLALWRSTREDEFLDAASACGQTMATACAGTVACHPVLALPERKPLPHEPRWSRMPGCYQLKAALGWLDLAREAGNPEFERRYHFVLDGAIRDEVSFLPGAPEPESVVDRLHAYAYFLEGLLPVADSPEHAQLFRQGIERLSGHLRSLRPRFERSDVYAQLLRVRLLGDRLGVALLDHAAAEEEAAAIATFQAESGDPRVDGCFLFGRKGGAFLPYANPVSTAFCVQALAMWEDYRAGKLSADWRALI